jgi:predicted nucleic acid-binding protein
VILVDTSIWVEHLRARSKTLETLLEDGQILAHPFVIGELALGHLEPRDVILSALSDLPRARSATDGEVLHLINRQGLAGLGIGYVDAHLLAAVRLTTGATLWTRDKRLHQVADQMGIASTQ